MTKTNLKPNQENTTNSNGEIFVKSIKISKNLATITYSTSSEIAAVEATYNGKEEVTDEFNKVFQENIQSVLAICPIFNKDSNKLTMNIIRFGYDSNGFLADAMYSVKYTFNPDFKQVMNLNLPKFPIYKEEYGDTKYCISGKYVDCLHEVIAKAKAYIKGETKTKQMKLVVDNT